MLPWQRQDHEERFASSILLSFAQLFKHLNTKLFRFEETLSVFDAPTLQSLRSLSLLRDASVMLEARNADADLEDVDKQLEQYIASLDSYMAKVYQEMATTEKQRVVLEWNSPLSQSAVGAFYTLPSAQAEQVMALVVLYDVLRRQAFRRLAALEHPPTDWEPVCPEGPDMLHGTAAKIFRRAAGVAVAAADRLQLIGDDALPRERPAVLRAAMLAALQQAALGEAQATMADRAERKNTSPMLVAGLYRSASDLFEGAAASIRKSFAAKDFSNGVSALMKRYLAISASLQEARARRCAAAVEQANSCSGRAIAHLREAARMLTDCVTVAEKDAQWGEVLNRELLKVNEFITVCDRERSLINFEPVPDKAPPLPEGRLIVSVQPFELPHSAQLVFY